MPVAMLLRVEQNWEGVCQDGFKTRGARASQKEGGGNLSFPPCHLKVKKNLKSAVTINFSKISLQP